MSLYANRFEAGRQLARELSAYACRDDVIVLGLPRGGVPVAYEVARALHVPLDIFPVGKLGAPGKPELAMGAVAVDGSRVVNDDVVEMFEVTARMLDALAAREQEKLQEQLRTYRGARVFPDLRDKTVILVDDGLATGATMRVAVAALREHQPQRIVVAVPTAAATACDTLEPQVDEVVCAMTPVPFLSVGTWYEDFAQTGDDEVKALLDAASRELRSDSLSGGAPA